MQVVGALLFLGLVVGVAAIYLYNRRFAQAERRKSAERYATWRDRALESLSLEPGGVTVFSVQTAAAGSAADSAFVPAILAFTSTTMVIFKDTELMSRQTVNLSEVSSTEVTHHPDYVVTTTAGAKFMLRPKREEGDLHRQVEEWDRQLTMRTRGGGSGSVSSVADELRKLAELRDQGVLDADDWTRAKSLFLGKNETERERSARELRQLHELHVSGVLSASEFNMKKWDILSRTS